MDIDKLQSLEEMLLYNNELTSTIPNGMTLLNNVLRLSLSYNYLKGTIPLEISKMEYLTLLHLHGNRVMGTLDIGQLVDSITDCSKTEAILNLVQCDDCSYYCNERENCLFMNTT